MTSSDGVATVEPWERSAQRPDLVRIGPVVRVQVQRSSLKLGERPHRWFDPGPIASVRALRVDAVGVTGLDADEGAIVDVHNRMHLQSKFRGENGVSIGFTSHYARMRERFGDRLADGIAGENILVQSEGMLTEADLAGGIVIATHNGEIVLAEVIVAAPCVEFAKFASGYTPNDRADRTITAAVDFLHHGMRGFYATLAAPQAQPAIIRPGDLVYRRRPAPG